MKVARQFTAWNMLERACRPAGTGRVFYASQAAVVRAGLPRLGAFSGPATTFGNNLPVAPNEPLVIREPRPTNVSAGG